MNSTTTLPNVSSSRVLDIDGMSGDACIQKVNTALNGVHGVTSQCVKVGSATFGADQPAYDAARAAIGVAGFKSREGAGMCDTKPAHQGNLKATPINPTSGATATPNHGQAVGVAGGVKPVGTDKPAVTPA